MDVLNSPYARAYGDTRFRPTNPQQDMFGPAGLLPPKKRAACEKSWAGPFREKALPILLRAEPEFAEFYDEWNGRPNRSAALVVGTLVLKEANDLTDEEALAALDFDLRWHYAFDLVPEESHICQKTLHNFRAKLLAGGKGAVVFRRLSDELIAALGVRVDRQRLDSTHILSNFARLNRLGLFCETIRVFLHALYKGSAPRFIIRARARAFHRGRRPNDYFRIDRAIRTTIINTPNTKPRPSPISELWDESEGKHSQRKTQQQRTKTPIPLKNTRQFISDSAAYSGHPDHTL